MVAKIRILTGLAIVSLLSGCGSDESASPEPSETASDAAPLTASHDSVATAEQLAAARKEAEANWEQIKLPPIAPPAPVNATCQTTLCEAQKAQFERYDWPRAWSGNYQAQRNVAFCRSSGCEGAVVIDRIEACAWRRVIISTHADKIKEMDTSSKQSDCERLSSDEGQVALVRTGALIRMIRP